MSITTFDTLKFAKRLKGAGVPDKQAEAEAEAIREAFSEALDTQVATKADIARLDRRLDLISWMIGLVFAAVVVPLIKSFLG